MVNLLPSPDAMMRRCPTFNLFGSLDLPRLDEPVFLGPVPKQCELRRRSRAGLELFPMRD
jgi:hypothetical protein